MIKAKQMNIQMEGMCRARYVGASLPSGRALPQHHVFINVEVSQNPVLWGFLWRFHHVGMIDHQPTSSPLPSLENGGCG